jgi:hypothetical protein
MNGGVLSDAVDADCAHMHACVREAPQLCDDERRDCTRQSLIKNPNPDNIKPTRPHASTPWALESVHVSMAHLRVYPCRYRSGVMSETILVFNGNVVSYQTALPSTCSASIAPFSEMFTASATPIGIFLATLGGCKALCEAKKTASMSSSVLPLVSGAKR